MQGLLICLSILRLLFEIRHTEPQGENPGFICADASVPISILIDMTENTAYYNQIWNPRINHTLCKFPVYGYVSLLDNYNMKSFIVIHQKFQNTCTEVSFVY